MSQQTPHLQPGAKMMHPNKTLRPQSITEVRELLGASQPPVGTHHGASAAAEAPQPPKGRVPVDTESAPAANDNSTRPVAPAKPKKSRKGLKIAAIITGAVVAVGALVIYLCLNRQIFVSTSVSGTAAGHEWLDMGTSVKWATTNVGTSSPKGYGDHYAWGEIATKADYSENKSETYGKSSIGNIAGNSPYDVAAAKWGNGWRMPTEVEFQELIDNCKWEWYGDGMKVTAKNGNVLFLPAAGFRYDASLADAGHGGYYWSATPSSDSYWALYLIFYEGYQGLLYSYCNYGRSVRPVRE